ncbi:hypothetical protein SDC9_195254 [bioreactor metagenome]|uniref:Uncharacterized protein n=1 Tax=bioreactor metagenome TaxID=1076179 RepID=A0A645I8J5_9ZZZZ
MDEDDAVALALLEVGRCNEHPDVKPGDPEQDGEGDKPGDHLAGQRVEGGWRSEAVKIEAVVHSRAIFRAAADAQGAKPIAAMVMAASSDKCPSPPRPDTVASTAPAPNISTGM